MTDNLLTDTGNDQPQIDPDKDYFSELVGEGRKFKDEKALARSKYEADQYIEILKKRLDVMRDDFIKEREENSTRAKLEDVLNQMQSRQQLTSNEETHVKEDIKPIDPKEIESLVSSKIQEYELTKKQTENFNFIKDKLQQKYGSNYKDAVNQQIQELGITEAELNDMARKAPKVLVKTLGLDQAKADPFQSPPRSQQRNDNFSPTSAAKRTWSYYQDLKKKDPNAWLDRKTAVQMQKDAIELGDAFMDGDYYVQGLHERN